MNYASAFLVLILTSAAVYWFISGRKFYTGPLIEAQAEFEPEVGSDGQSDKEKKESMGV
jgi:hypothetical protein